LEERVVNKIKKRIFLFLLLLSLVGGHLVSLPCWGADITGSEGPVFSLGMENKPLINVLDHISNVTGYEITVNEAWANAPLTATLNDVTVEEGLRKIIERLGRLSYLIVTYKESKRIEILIIPAHLAEGKGQIAPPPPKKTSRRPVRVRQPSRRRRK
jgi:hypothetical protein